MAYMKRLFEDCIEKLTDDELRAIGYDETDIMYFRGEETDE